MLTNYRCGNSIPIIIIYFTLNEFNSAANENRFGCQIVQAKKFISQTIHSSPFLFITIHDRHIKYISEEKTDINKTDKIMSYATMRNFALHTSFD